MAKIKSFDEFVNELDKSKDSDNKISIEKVSEIVDEKNLKGARILHPLQRDVWIYRLAIILLGLIVIFVLVISCLMTCCYGKSEIPSGIIAIGATSVGALASLISMSKKN